MDTGDRQQPHGSAAGTLIFRYGVAVAAVAVAVLARWLLDPILGDTIPLVTVIGAVAVAVWQGGYGPALVATVLGYLACAYLFIEPRGSLGLDEARNLVGLVAYLVTCSVVIWFGEAMRIARRRSAEQKERLRTTLASIGDAVITTDTAGRVTNLNAVAETLTGWTNAEAWGQPLDVVFHIVNEATRKAVENPAFRALREGVIVGLANHTILIAKDGTERPIDDSAAPIRCKLGEVVGCVLVFRDISERHQQEAELRSQERQFRTLAESIPHLAWIANPDGHIFWYNRRWYDYTGTTLEQMEGWGWQSVHDPAELPKVLERWKGSIATGEPFDMVFPLKGSDGAFRPFLTRVEPVKDDGGRVVRWFGTNTDITEQQKAEQELRRRETFIGGVLGSITDGFFAVCKDWRFTFVNDEIVRRFGRLRGEIVGQHIWELFPAAVGNEAYVQLQRAMADRVAVEYEVVFEPWQRWFLDKAFPTDDGGLAVYTRDITDRKKAESLQAGHVRVLELVATGRPLPDVLGVVCEIIEQHEPGLLCSVLLPDERRRHIGVAVGPSLSDGHSRGLVGLEIGPPYIGSCGPVFDCGEVVVVPDVQADERFAPEWRALLTAHGLRACRSTPILESDGTVLASFAIYRREAGDPTPANPQLLQTATHLAGIAIHRMRGGERLRASEERLRLVVDSATDYAIFTMDTEGIINGWNAGAARLFCYSEAEVVGQHDRLLYTPEDAAQKIPEREMRKAGADGRAVNERWHARKDGSLFWGSGLVQPLRGGGGVVGFLKIMRDMTEQREYEERLRQSEERFAALVEQCPFGIYIVDDQFRIASMNEGSQKGAFANVRPVIGRPFDEAMRVLWPEPVAAEVINRFRHTLDTGEPYHSWDFVNPRADIDQTEGYEWELRRITLPGGRHGVVCYYFDATPLRQAERELKEADRKKDEFLATLAHELRNPLAPICNGLQVIRMAGATGTIEQARSMMERQLGQMVRLVDDLLDVSRVTTGKLTLTTDRLELRAVIDAALETSRPVIEQAGHDLAVVVPDEPIIVEGDLTRLAQVVSNLLTNSAKYTHRGGHIRVSVERQDGTAVVSVKDDGIGIPTAMLRRVFKMFIQVDRTLEKTTGGLGIGLSLVRGLVEMHGGTIEARSDGEGQGSEFVVRLPVVTASVGEADRLHGQAEEIVPSGRRRVLVVDDNADAADSLGQLLEMLGNEVRTAYDGEAGVAAAGEFRPAVVLCDIGMPKVNGYEACRRIRAEPWGKGMVLVALTGWGQEDDRQKSSDAGFDHHLVKPVEFAALMKLMAGLPNATA